MGEMCQPWIGMGQVEILYNYPIMKYNVDCNHACLPSMVLKNLVLHTFPSFTLTISQSQASCSTQIGDWLSNY